MNGTQASIWQNHIDGHWESSAVDDSLPVINPASGQTLGHMPMTTADDVNRAIDVADRAFKPWCNTPPLERSALLRRVAALMRDRVDDMAIPITKETGKPIGQARGEIEGSAKYLEWFAEEGRRLHGELIRQRGPGEMALVSHEPVGVVAAMTAWNFPISLVCRKIGPALAAGCTIIVRPAVEGAGALNALFHCIKDAGIPDGVVQLLLGDAERISDTMMDDVRVRKISFTGSVPIGKRLIERSAATVKRLSMELGGHAPFIVFDDMDGTKLGALAAKRKFANAGQICISPGRFFIHESISEAFTKAFVETTLAIKVGDPMDVTTDMGPLVNTRRLDAIQSLLDDAQNTARVLCGGNKPAALASGFYIRPAVVDQLSDDSRLMCEETFGPIAPITTFRDEDEVIERANDSEFGLAAFLFTESLGRAHRVSNALECGIVAVNTMTIGMPEAPFGGMKQSGFGREGSWMGLQDYVQPKLTLIKYELG